ncbi:hypothetical protein PM082_017403 [Marasmius tenuissimus]|nr:hypothetical protein PM082_017403 [Marasmius tenuissimus]
MSITYLVDDQDPAIEYLCPVTKQPKVRDNYLNNTYTTIAGSECGGGWFKYKFHGTSVRVSSRLSSPDADYAVQVDISPMLQRSGNGVYQSPELVDGREHSIVYAVGNQSLSPAFDYLTVTAGHTTRLHGKTIIVDDEDDEIQYSGNWRTEPISPPTVAFDYTSSPYLDTTHWSNTVGDSVTYSFKGSSVAVYGVIPFSQLFPNRTISASYAIDGGEPEIRSFTPSIEGHPIAMSQFFLSERLSEGRHTLVVEVTDIPDLTMLGFGLDFITYNASFDSLSAAGRGDAESAEALGGHALVWQPVLGALLGFVALLIGIFGWLWWRKRKQAKARAERTSRAYVIENWKSRGIQEGDKVKNGSLTADV